ncbi:hypothetical protein DL93DRAFT_2079059 [Clavulina sp. PMI_390]|nr:hypothetical protein DL93DRAFT_2079059 [Clavulina sp. PMI_390]
MFTSEALQLTTLPLYISPIMSGSSIPTHEEMANVQSLNPDMALTIEQSIFRPVHSPPYSRQILDDTSLNGIHCAAKDGLILTRAERQLIKGTWTGDSTKTSNTSSTSPSRKTSPSALADQRSLDVPARSLTPLARHPRVFPESTTRLIDDTQYEPISSPGYLSSGDARPDENDIEKDAYFLDLLGDGLAPHQVASSVWAFRKLMDPSVDEEEDGLVDQLPAEVTAHSLTTSHEPDDTSNPTVDTQNRNLVLPHVWSPPSSIHRYIASVNLIQKRALVSCLMMHSLGAVDVVEYLSHPQTQLPDLILDSENAILFFPIQQLPSSEPELMERVHAISEGFPNVLLVLEAYPNLHSFSAPNTAKENSQNFWQTEGSLAMRMTDFSDADIFSLPVIVAMKKLRRELAIKRGLSDEGVIELVCALNVREAAIYARLWGDQAESRCNPATKALLWGEREWLFYDNDEVSSNSNV